MTFVNPPDDRFMRLPEVCLSTALSKPTIYRGVRDGSFPKPVKYGGSSLWSETEIREWKARLKEGRGADDGRE